VSRIPVPSEAAPTLPRPTPSGPTSSTTPTTTTPGPPPVGPAAVAPAGAGDEADRRVVQELLDRYDRALTDLSAAPEAADDPADPILAAWHAVVPAGSELDEGVRGRIRGRRAEGLLVEPVEPGTLSYVHRAEEVVRSAHPAGVLPPPEELAFTWCGWSPGLGRRVSGPGGGPGPVVDDAVAHALGTGRVVRPGPDEPWMLGDLLESELTLLPPGSTDPCG